MNIDYDPAYNNTNNKVYQNVNAAIQTQCTEIFGKRLRSVKINEIRRGSTVVDYTVTATSIQETDTEAVKLGIFTQLAKIYPMIYDSSTPLQFEPPFFGKRATLTCGPIPSSLNFIGSWTAEWRRDKVLIPEDPLHIFVENKDNATLTVSKFFITDTGDYECALKERNIFRQKSNGLLSYKGTPVIQITPVRQKIKCEVGRRVSLTCSVNSPYKVQFKNHLSAGTGEKITYVYILEECSNEVVEFICQVATVPGFQEVITLEISTGGDFVCLDESVFGVGNVGDRAEMSCDEGDVGEKIAECQKDGRWEIIEENCILEPIHELLIQSQTLTNNSLPIFLQNLSNVTLNYSSKVVKSPANINAIVEILNNVGNKVSSSNIIINDAEMEDVLLTAGVLTTDGAKQSWDTLNTKSTSNSSVTKSIIPKPESASSSLLLSLETITTNLNNNSFDIETPSIVLNKTTFNDTFNANFNSSVEIDIPETEGGRKSITVITFSSMNNVLPARDEENSTLNVINGRVVLVQTSGDITNISFAFNILNSTLGKPQCVFWNFSLFGGLGGWDNQGCEVTLNINGTVTCNCNHLTSFSILMSPFGIDFPLLDYITYIGVGISMLSLVICLIIEAVIWRKIRRNNTAYLRHVSIVNIAVSLLIADIWFIIGAAISDSEVKNPPACTAATFFIHLFYLALFFWMLASALLLLYRTVNVFGGDLSKGSLLAIGFSLGYGAPIIIAVITIAVTAPKDEYTRESGVCWLNWFQSKALLAFVIPALLIVVINLCILLVVLYKMLRRRAVVDSAQAADRNALAVIARTLAFLTPIFGLTWGLGVGTMTDPYNIGTHIAFAFFNSLQGFFILLFGTLLDRKVWTELAKMTNISSGTRSTSAGTSSTGGLGIFRNWRRRDGYNVSSNESGASQSFMNT